MTQDKIDEYLRNILNIHGLSNGYVYIIKELSKRILLTEKGQVCISILE
jgi:hypothetical protein